MTLIAVPNISDGRDLETIRAVVSAAGSGASSVLDVHTDAVHNRSVITLTASASSLAQAVARLASEVVARIDLRRHEGAHPRTGALDVCPVVPHEAPIEEAVAAAHSLGAAIHDRTGVSIYFYGHAALRPGGLELPEVRRGGLDALARRARGDLGPDLGSVEVNPATGVVCVGARYPLIAFNVWLRSSIDQARAAATSVREATGGPPGIRAFGLRVDDRLTQVSMNLVDPATTGVDAAFAAVERAAEGVGAMVVATELVGLVPARFMPDPHKEAARLLIEPGRTLEAALAAI